MGLLHLAQAIAVLLLANTFALPVTGSFLRGPPGSGLGTPETLFEIRIGWAIAAFLLLSAAAHFAIATPGVFEWYRRNLERTRNDARWIEYSVSASIMFVVIAMLTGISDVAALVAPFGVNASMIFFGLVQERYERPGGSLLPFWLGAVVGAVPWVAIAIYLIGPGSAASPPGFVYAIFVSLFPVLQQLRPEYVAAVSPGRSVRDYMVGERVYVLLSRWRSRTGVA